MEWHCGKHSTVGEHNVHHYSWAPWVQSDPVDLSKKRSGMVIMKHTDYTQRIIMHLYLYLYVVFRYLNISSMENALLVEVSFLYWTSDPMVGLDTIGKSFLTSLINPKKQKRWFKSWSFLVKTLPPPGPMKIKFQANSVRVIQGEAHYLPLPRYRQYHMALFVILTLWTKNPAAATE